MNRARKMKMKLLDHALLGILAGLAPVAMAQDATLTAANSPVESTPVENAPVEEAALAAPTVFDCDDAGCAADEGLLFRLRTRSYDVPVTTGTDEDSGSAALQPDRRVSVALEQPGRADIVGSFSINLPGGGVIWATEDPDIGQPELSVSAPAMVPFADGRIQKPVRFFVRGNYVDFVTRYEVTMFRANDADLVAPVARFELPVAAVSQDEWDGAMPST